MIKIEHTQIIDFRDCTLRAILFHRVFLRYIMATSSEEVLGVEVRFFVKGFGKVFDESTHGGIFKRIVDDLKRVHVPVKNHVVHYIHIEKRPEVTIQLIVTVKGDADGLFKN